MAFQIQSLDAANFSPLFKLSDEDLKAKGGLRMMAQSENCTPCRVSLQDARKGEKVILINYQHQMADTPYRANAAIFVRENALSASLDINHVRTQFRARIMAGRAFGDDDMMIDANLCHGEKLEEMIEQLFALSGVAYIHLHFAKHGCFAAKVKRIS